MIIITRKKAHTCTDAELRSALAKLYNVLACRGIDADDQRAAYASIETIRAELCLRDPR